MSAILRHHHRTRFTVLPNDAIRNPALSFRAVGVLAHLLSLPDGARVDSATLARAHKEGRDAVRAAFAELGGHGYYRRQVVRLSDGTLRTEVVVSSTPMDERPGGTGDGFSGVGRPEPENPASVEPAPVDQAPREVPEQETSSPPTPRPAGGQDVPGRRRDGTNLRALGVNPRAEAASAVAERARLEAAAHQASIDLEATRRRAEVEAARAEIEAGEAEALALSGALDDDRLAAVVGRVGEGLAGPLARSPLAVARAVVVWCRAVAAQQPGPLLAAVEAGLADDGWRVTGHERVAPLRELPAAPQGTRSLRERVAGLVRTTAAEAP